MRHKCVILLFLAAVFYRDVKCKKPKQPVPFVQYPPHNPKYHNPGYIKDRAWTLGQAPIEKMTEQDLKATLIKKPTPSGNAAQSGTAQTGTPDQSGKPAQKGKKGMQPDNNLNNRKKPIKPHRPSIPDDQWVNRFRKPFHPAWMDYCDPYHCNDYNKIACGLNRKTMHFKWFKSGCHISLNNICAYYRGNLKYDIIDSSACLKYVMDLRNGCSQQCDDDVDPVCGISSYDNHVVVFKNPCYFEKANCNKKSLSEYEAVHIDLCRNTLVYNKYWSNL